VVSGAVVSGVSFSSVLCVVADGFGSGDGVSGSFVFDSVSFKAFCLRFSTSSCKEVRLFHFLKIVFGRMGLRQILVIVGRFFVVVRSWFRVAMCNAWDISVRIRSQAY